MKKAFLFTVLSSIILLLLIAMMSLFSHTHSYQANSLVVSSTFSVASDSFRSDVSKILKMSDSSNSTHYIIVENFSSGKSSSVQSRLSSYNSLLQRYANLTASNISFNASSYYGVLACSGAGFGYRDDANAKTLAVNGSFSHVRFDVSGSAVITDTCNNAGTTNLTIVSGQTFSKRPGAACAVTLNYSSYSVTVGYNASHYVIDYAQAPSEMQVRTAANGSSVPFECAANATSAPTASTSNPGYIEPPYPGGAGAVKHYGSVSIYGAAHYVIVMDYDDSGSFDSAFVSPSTNFTGVVFSVNQSQMYLNSRVFVITVAADGSAVGFDEKIGAHFAKQSDEMTGVWA